MKTLIVLAVCASILGILCRSESATAQTADYCKGATRSVAVLIDRTTDFDALDRKFLEESVPALDRHLTFGTYVVVRTIGEGFALNRTEFEGCVPGCAEKSVVDQFLGSRCVPVVANADRTKFRSQFFQKLKEISLSPERSSQSDIARTIVETSRSLNKTERPLAELVVFSDMIDNVIVGHRIIYTQDHRRTLEQANRQNVRAELKGANVSVFGFGRLDIAPRSSLSPDQYEKLRSFWLAWFEESGAKAASLGVRLQ